MTNSLGTLVKEIKLPSGDIVLEFKITSKNKELLYKSAKTYLDITLTDLLYQAEKNPNQTFKDILIGAFVYHAVKNRVHKEEKLQKSKKTNDKRKPRKVSPKNKRTLNRSKKTTTKR